MHTHEISQIYHLEKGEKNWKVLWNVGHKWYNQKNYYKWNRKLITFLHKNASSHEPTIIITKLDEI